jgi:hypothetical protein
MTIPKEFACYFIKFIDLSFIELNCFYKKKYNLSYERFADSFLTTAFSSTTTDTFDKKAMNDSGDESLSIYKPIIETLEAFLQMYYPNLTELQKQHIDSFIEEEIDYDRLSLHIQTLSFDNLVKSLTDIVYQNCTDYLDIKQLIASHQMFIYEATVENYNSLQLYYQLSDDTIDKYIKKNKTKV